MATAVERPSADDLIGDLLDRHPSAARVLFDHRMHCVGCAIAAFETLGEACAVYGVDVDVILAEIADADRGPRPNSA